MKSVYLSGIRDINPSTWQPLGNYSDLASSNLRNIPCQESEFGVTTIGKSFGFLFPSTISESTVFIGSLSPSIGAFCPSRLRSDSFDPFGSSVGMGGTPVGSAFPSSNEGVGSITPSTNGVYLGRMLQWKGRGFL